MQPPEQSLCQNPHPLQEEQGGSGILHLLLLHIRLTLSSAQPVQPSLSWGPAAAAEPPACTMPRISSLGFVLAMGQSVHICLRCMWPSSSETGLGVCCWQTRFWLCPHHRCAAAMGPERWLSACVLRFSCTGQVLSPRTSQLSFQLFIHAWKTAL